MITNEIWEELQKRIQRGVENIDVLRRNTDDFTEKNRLDATASGMRVVLGYMAEYGGGPEPEKDCDKCGLVESFTAHFDSNLYNYHEFVHTEVTGHEDCNAWHDAAIEADYAWYLYRTASNPFDQGDAMVRLANKMHDLRTWLPGYDYETSTLPWERDEDD